MRIPDAQRAQRLADSRRVMPEVVHHRDAAGNTPHFHAPFDPLEGVECRLDLLVLQAAVLGAGDHGQRIAHIQFSDQVDVKLETRNLKLRRRRSITQVECLDRVSFAQAEPFHRAMSHLKQ